MRLQEDGAEGGAGVKSKDFQALLEKMDVAQSVSSGRPGERTVEGGGRRRYAQAGPGSGREDRRGRRRGYARRGDQGRAGHFDEDGRGRTATQDDADAGLNQALALLGVAASVDKNLSRVLDIVKTLRVSAKGKLVTLKGEVSADVLEEALGKEKDK